VVVIRPPARGDAKELIAARDAVFHRFLGEGEDDPKPAGCIVAGGEIVGWVDYDDYRAWRLPGEVNLGYNVFAAHRGRGYASRAVQLLMHHLAISGEYDTATLLIHPQNARSLALASRNRFTPHGDLDGNPYFKRPVPPLAYGDGTVTIRRRRVEDLDADLEAKDDEQIDRLWLPGQREAWEAMSADEQRAHALHNLQTNRDDFGSGPKWTFSVDTPSAECVAYVDCDLANDHVPPGEANISYTSHPAHRGRGYVSRAVRMVLRFLRDHTGARRAHLLIDRDNAASLRVAAAIGAEACGSRTDERGRTLIRHAIEI
jgi:RimJ/RimL family protein N-acetyltransferase